MIFSRHARDRLRLYAIDAEQAEAIVAAGLVDGSDRHGNPRYAGELPDGRGIRVGVALDNPEVVISLYPRRKP